MAAASVTSPAGSQLRPTFQSLDWRQSITRSLQIFASKQGATGGRVERQMRNAFDISVGNAMTMEHPSRRCGPRQAAHIGSCIATGLSSSSTRMQQSLRFAGKSR